MAITIRPYADADFNGVRELWESVFPDDPPRNRAERSIPAKQKVQPELFLLALRDDRVIGTVMAGYDGHRGWLYAVAVAPDARRSGVGTQLIRDAEARLSALGCIKVNLQVRGGNNGAARFYERLGYLVEPRISFGKEL
jgi:ribosomal protein S18 acetylase RimI-like enzyme